MIKRRILLIGGNYSPEPTGIGKYNGEMIKWLAEQGNDCTVVTTYPYYPEWKVQSSYGKQCFWYKTETQIVKNGNPIKVIRCPHFVPKNPSGLNRMISEFSFFFSAYLVMMLLLFKKKYNQVITVAPPFEMGLLGILYKKIRGGEFIYHIQDLQIDAARDLAIIKSKVIINIFLSIEKFILSHADIVSTISVGMIKKVRNKCQKEVLFFPNWVDVNTFYPVANRHDLKPNYGFDTTDKIILYSGAIGNKQGLEAILYCAKSLQNRKDIKFAICGSGPYKANLIHLKEKLNLKNVFFLPLQPIKTFNSFLNVADIHLVLQKSGAGDLVMPSKLSTILSVGGVAIVTASKGTSLYEVISSGNMGILVEPDNEKALLDAIINSVDSELKEHSENARLYAEKNLSAYKILDDFFSVVFKVERNQVKSSIGELRAKIA
ncbi:WcaI family glycosyltransferase [Segetibacter sp.]|jgi:colanic acid biosynthesis glycosyl transferase WcaI|uniref:WcaI family glycosyltransferase n=1 Tax=Segetibacter sp. TaxID=2231182 RepID=UPI00260E75B2|nr:WcaI family glycosyltransferase [Segetibacter sp.]MCW3081051.1 glycosyl transferase, group 1 family protein [Segetibacter sp.]